MQPNLLFGHIPSLSAEIDRRLHRQYGPLSIYDRLDPVSQLVLALLGTRTKGRISLKVFDELRKRFQDWREIVEISEAALAKYLPVTYGERKAIQLRQALRIIIAKRGSLCLDFLEIWPVDEAQTWLKTLPGVGPKVSAAVLNFSTLRKRVLVVDGHHFRVAKRLGLLRRNTPFTSAQRVLMNQHIPNDWTADDLDDHHTLMKRHGQLYCCSHRPHCMPCPLRDICAAWRNGHAISDNDRCPDEAYGGDERLVTSEVFGSA